MKDAIKALLSRDDTTGAIAVTTAIVRLYARQTSDEQSRGTTVEQNGRGFNAFHAKDGTCASEAHASGQGRIVFLLSYAWHDACFMQVMCHTHCVLHLPLGETRV